MKYSNIMKINKSGLILGIVAALLVLIYFWGEFMRSPGDDLLTLVMGVKGLIFGLGISVIPMIIAGLLAQMFGLDPISGYPLMLLGLSVGFFITYYLVGWFLDYIYHKISVQGKLYFRWILGALIAWLFFSFIISFFIKQWLSVQGTLNASPVVDEWGARSIPFIYSFSGRIVDFFRSVWGLGVFVVVSSFLAWAKRWVVSGK